MNKGEAKLSGQLLTPRANQNVEAMLKISIDNSKSEYFVKSIQFDLKRTIIAYANNVNNEKKEFKDEQIVMSGKFQD